jgi:hypothetical protein
VPGFASGQQRDDLQQDRHREHPRRGVGDRCRELVAASGEDEHEERGRQKRSHDRDQRASAATELPDAGSQSSHSTRAE